MVNHGKSSIVKVAPSPPPPLNTSIDDANQPWLIGWISVLSSSIPYTTSITCPPWCTNVHCTTVKKWKFDNGWRHRSLCGAVRHRGNFFKTQHLTRNFSQYTNRQYNTATMVYRGWITETWWKKCGWFSINEPPHSLSPDHPPPPSPLPSCLCS